MKRVSFLLILLLLVPSVVFSQAIPTSKLGWDQDAPTLSDAQAYTYKYYADGSSTGAVLSNVTCTGSTSPFVCTAPFPAFTPGNHSIKLTASNLAGESSSSLPLDFTFIVTPSVPRGLRIIGG